VNRRAPTDHPLHDLLAERWSPYGFDPRPLPAADLRSLFEAARWAPSSYNEQPWRYLVARREDETAFADALSCLVEANRQWARHASVLVVAVAALNFERNGKPNSKALHDVGQASAQLTVEATSRGLVVHQMGGILPDRARELYGIPEGFAAVTALAIGYAADPDALPDALRERDTAPRARRPQSAFVFAGGWGRAADPD
jgi:nitroreductase